MLLNKQITIPRSLRMATGFVQGLIKLCGLDWRAPNYTTLCRRQKHIAMSYQKSSDGLHLVVDSSNLKLLGEGEFKKHGLNIVVNGVSFILGSMLKTLQIRAVQLTTNNVSDTQVLGD